MNESLQTRTIATQSCPEAERLDARKAILTDIGPVLKLINSYATLGIMLPRTEFELSESIRDFVVARAGDRLVGCGALHFYSPLSGEIRSLAVDPEWKGHGVGTRLMDALEKEARENGLQSIFAFTYVPEFFRKLGFGEVDREELPSKVWKDCLRCPKFQCCDEIAMRKILQPTLRVGRVTPICGGDRLENNGTEGAVFLPIPKKL